MNRLSLRTVLIIITFACVLAGYLALNGWLAQPSEHHQDEVAATSPSNESGQEDSSEPDPTQLLGTERQAPPPPLERSAPIPIPRPDPSATPSSTEPERESVANDRSAPTPQPLAPTIRPHVAVPISTADQPDPLEPPLRDVMEDDELADALLEALPEISRCQEMLLDLFPEAPDPFDANIEIWVRANPDDPDRGIPEVHSISIGELVIEDVACFVEAIEELDVPPPDESEGELYATRVRATLAAD